MRSGQHGSRFLSGQETDFDVFVSFGRHGQDALDESAVLGHAQGCEREERVDGCQPCITGGDAVAAVGRQVVQERADERGIPVGEVQGAGRLAGALTGVSQQESESVAVGGDGVGADATLRHQIVGEERFEKRREGGHDSAPWAVVGTGRSRRWAAIANSSGAACRYQSVDAGEMWPIQVDSTGSCD